MFSLAGAGDALPTNAATPCVVGFFFQHLQCQHSEVPLKIKLNKIMVKTTLCLQPCYLNFLLRARKRIKSFSGRNFPPFDVLCFCLLD